MDFSGVEVKNMWNPNEPVSGIFHDVLNDENCGPEDDDFVEELVEVDEPESDNVMECIVQPDGSLGRTRTEENAQADISDTDEEEAAAYAKVEAISPLTSPVQHDDPSPPRFDIRVMSPPVRRNVGGRRRGRGVGRGGYRNRGGGRAGRSGWMRGEPLLERFVSDDELPAHLREEISQVLADRERRGERQTRMRGDVEDDVEDDGQNNEMNEDRMFFESQTFEWKPMDESWSGRKETFASESCGPTRVFTNAYAAFRNYWDDEIMSHIVVETNRYAQTIQRQRFQENWYDTNIDEIFTLFCFWIMLGIIHMPSIKSCFSSMPLLRTEIFRTLFTENRYWNVNAALHFSSGPSDGSDPMHPIRPVVDHINAKFKSAYNLHQDVSIDESLTLWKGPLSFKQYIKTKSARFGIKTYQLCESTTGYLWSFIIYAGRATAINTSLMATVSTVLGLIRPILNKGHTLFMDNFFNSPTLARYLKRHGTDCVGTLRNTRKHVPLSVQRCPLAEGEYIARHADDVMVMAMHDRKRTTCISTYHDMTQIQTEARPGHPSQHRFQMIADYNHGMGGVDRLDQMLEPYLVERKQCLNWSKKFFKRILNVSIQNARILVEKSTNTKIDSLAFRLALASELMEHHLPHIPRSRNPPRPSLPIRPSRLTERHFITRIAITEEMRATVRHKNNLGRRRCILCTRAGRDRRTVYECANCRVALCLENCFKTYHTVV